jgi:N-acetylglutamate synthase/N-acetylornithine aminotransferase
VGEADEVDTHVLDELHLLVDEVVGDGGGVACVVFVAVRAAEEKTFAVEVEGAVLAWSGRAGSQEAARAEVQSSENFVANTSWLLLSYCSRGAFFADNSWVMVLISKQ